jgi:tRNA pseudouridine13 synthase
MTTREVVKALARKFALDESQIGYAGLKDKEARCTQTFSLTLADDMDEDEAVRKANGSLGFKVHWAKRHGNKLKRGHLLGNRFEVLVSGVGDGALNCAQAVADALNERGLPNYFGEQRFGAAGDNAEAGRRAIKSRGGKGSRDNRSKWFRSLMLNAYQAELFNRWLAERIQRGEFGRLLMGDIAKKTDTGGLFEVEDPIAEQPRLDGGEITYTGPIYGHKMRSAAAQAGQREAEVLEAEGVTQQDLKKAGLKGSRRPARLIPGPILITPHDKDGSTGLWFSFALPKGSYATTLLREFIK